MKMKDEKIMLTQISVSTVVYTQNLTEYRYKTIIITVNT
jgi:hypothetical protein